MELTAFINHPERLDRDTLYELRSMLALNPYFQTARLLMLQNLYLLHDSAFDEELRRAALYITDRKVIFNMVEAAHYQLRKQAPLAATQTQAQAGSTSRTIDLIDTFLDSIPADEEQKETKRRPTPADAAIDYVAYLLESETDAPADENTPQLKGHDLIDNFLQQEQGRIMLSELPQTDEEDADQAADSDNNDEEYFTETLARIYIKQGRYQKALDIISRLSNKYPQKNAYFADQIRFLEKLIINSNNKKNK
jgi:thioredoxin-like negative regulator of GroEL